MKRLVLILLAALAVQWGCGGSRPVDQSKLVGHWVGSGEFNETGPKSSIGALSIDLRFAADQTITGRVGGASLKDAKFDGHEVRGLLVGQVHPTLTKDHFLLIVSAPDGESLEVGFQLKSNYTFDAGMSTGQGKLTRVR